MNRTTLLAASALLLSMSLAADTLYLNNGATYNGHFEGDRDARITFQDSRGAQYQFPIGDLQSIAFNRTGETVVLRDGKTYFGQITGPQGDEIRWVDRQGISYQFPTYQVASISFTEGWKGPYESQQTGIVLPAGTEISVMSNVPIDSQNAQPGQTFRASITQDVVDSQGRVVIPRNSDATLILRKESGGGVHGGDIVLDLDSVMVNGVRQTVASSDVVETSDRQGLGKNRRTGEYLGGGAALGALIGAIAGGGKGAAIGAAAGAGAGAVGVIATHGHRVYVPAETVLTFNLDQPLVLRPGGRERGRY
jgi:hypothetical protein